VKKRVLDLAVTLVGLPLVLPLVAVAAIGLAIELRGWPIFLQTRIGHRGHPFTLVKLRTMRHSDKTTKTDYTVEDWSSFVFGELGADNSRTTRLGALLRKSSVDELPNLWNVATGDMSLVGPRPEIPEIVRQYPQEYHRRHAVRPGITGLAQVRGRSDVAYADIIKYDLAYVDQHSISGDVRLLLETFGVVFRGSGAR